MKKFKLLALALAIGTVTLFATEIELDEPVKTIGNEIEMLFTPPDFYIDQETVVNITFTFGPIGELIVLDVQTDNHKIINYVYKSLNHKFIKNPGELDKLFKIDLRVLKN